MKQFTPILIVCIVACLTSCVNRIAIPEDEESKLFITLEMLKGDRVIVADFKTTNNLNGTHPIESPENATIHVFALNPGEIDVDKEIFFQFDETLKKYVAEWNVNEHFLSHGKRYQMDAKIEGSNYKDISSVTLVPYPIKIESFELKDETTVIDREGNEFWQGTLGIHFLPSNTLADNFGHLQIHGFETTKVITPEGDVNYYYGVEKRFFDLVNVNTGYQAITDLVHKDGFFIDFDKLEDNYIEIEIKSNFPITQENQVTDMLRTDLMSVSKEHYNYHISYHNIKQSQGNIFEENALYISNIEKGLGLFSSCVNTKMELELRK